MVRGDTYQVDENQEFHLKCYLFKSAFARSPTEISPLSEMWGIGSRTEKSLNAIRINFMMAVL